MKHTEETRTPSKELTTYMLYFQI